MNYYYNCDRYDYSKRPCTIPVPHVKTMSTIYLNGQAMSGTKKKRMNYDYSTHKLRVECWFKQLKTVFIALYIDSKCSYCGFIIIRWIPIFVGFVGTG